MAVRSLKNSTIENFASYNSSMNAGYSFQDYELIESVFVASTTVSVIFNNLNQYATEYKHLQIRASGKTSSAGITYIVGQFNSVTTTTYDAHWLVGNGTSVGSAASINRNTFYICRHDPQANNFNAGVVDIFDAYSTIKNKTTRTLTGGTGTSPSEIYLFSGLWRNTSAINSITILTDGGLSNIAAGSRFSLYGIR